MTNKGAVLIVAVLFPFASASLAQTNRYVWSGGLHSSPFTNWATAARDIQSAIDVSEPGDVIWVTNGVYAVGGRVAPGWTLTNRVYIHKPVIVRSVNGPSRTAIRGAWDPTTTNGPAAVRCVWMTNNAQLHGFTITNGATLSAGDGYNLMSGGGIWAYFGGTVSNCVLTMNRAGFYGGGTFGGKFYNCILAGNGGATGGGAQGGIFYNCLFLGNSASTWGGGGAWCSMYNCVLTRNSGSYGGAAYGSSLYNCEAAGNSGGYGAGVYLGAAYNCLVISNSASTYGGGANSANLCNCTVLGNTAGGGGGVFDSTNWNTIVWDNKFTWGWASNYTGSAFNFCCTGPKPGAGAGNIDVSPEVDTTNRFRLVRGSPCINAGTNFPWQASDPEGRGRDKDIDGVARIQLGVVDMGACEYVPPGTIFTIFGNY